MEKAEEIREAFRTCIADPAYCDRCPRHPEADKKCQQMVQIPLILALDVIGLIDAQKPMEPKPNVKEDLFDYYRCGSCGVLITLNSKYCSECGRQVKWDV